MTPIQELQLGSNQAYIYHQVLDFDGDGYDDLAVLFADRLVVYSPAAQEFLWQVPGVKLCGFVIGNTDADSSLDAVLFTETSRLLKTTFPDTTADSVGFLLDYTMMYPAHTPAHLVLQDLGHDGKLDLVVSRIRVFYGVGCMNGTEGIESRTDIWTFSLPDFMQGRFYQQIGGGLRRSDEWLSPGDLDGDGLDELVSTGRTVWSYCEIDSWGSPYNPATDYYYDINVYNQLGQRLSHGTAKEASAIVADFDSRYPGNECVVRARYYIRSDFAGMSYFPHSLFSFKIDNGLLRHLWDIDASGYRMALFTHPDLPHTVGIESSVEPVWDLRDSRDGSLAHRMLGLAPNRVTIGGHFSPAADTGLLIAQVSGGSLVLFGTAIPTAIDEPTPENLPDAFVLYPNYPNPFNPTTRIAFSLPIAGETTLEIFNIAGQRVAVPLHDYLTAGEHLVLWDASGLASGVYLYRLSQGDYSQSRKMMLLK